MPFVATNITFCARFCEFDEFRGIYIIIKEENSVKPTSERVSNGLPCGFEWSIWDSSKVMIPKFIHARLRLMTANEFGFMVKVRQSPTTVSVTV